MARINRMIDLFERGEVLYYTSPGELTYENGRDQAGTWADFFLVDFENRPFDVPGLAAFMRGLVDGGPTPDGYRTPAVLASVPANARSAAEVYATAWQIRQVLNTGIHGVLHTHARQADAVRVFVETCRYPMATIGRDNGLGEGQRGSGGQALAAPIWGITPHEYIQRADPWPLNPDGELILGLKIEDREGLASVHDIVKIPGIALAEWGPGDMGMSFGYADAHDPPYPPEMDEARKTIKQACDDHGIHFLSSWNDHSRSHEENVQTLLDWGVRVISGGGEEVARVGRRMTGRE